MVRHTIKALISAYIIWFMIKRHLQKVLLRLWDQFPWVTMRVQNWQWEIRAWLWEEAQNHESHCETMRVEQSVCIMHIMPHQNKSKYKLIIAQCKWSTQTTFINKFFNFMIILRFICLIYVYHDNKKPYHHNNGSLWSIYHTIDIIGYHYKKLMIFSIWKFLCDRPHSMLYKYLFIYKALGTMTMKFKYSL